MDGWIKMTLQDKTVALKALTLKTVHKSDFDPAKHPRDEDGRWARLGSAISGLKGRIVGSSLKTRMVQAVDHAYGHLSKNSKELISGAAANLLTQGHVSDMETEAMKVSILHLAERMQVPALQAKDYVINTLKALRSMHMSKAAETTDEFIAKIDALIEKLKNLDFKDEKTQVKKPKSDKDK
jgi:hypothetical protein